MTLYDVVVIGGGIVGLATARGLLRAHPDWKVLVTEKESRVAAHQTGHNSGVIHSGIYYRPGSEKALLCRAGRRLLIDYLDEHGIEYHVWGKLILALRPEDRPNLEMLRQRAGENGIPGCRRLSDRQIREMEPEAGGVEGLYVPETASVDYAEVSRSLAKDIQMAGGEIRLGSAVESVQTEADRAILNPRVSPIAARFLVNCGGLESDRIARMAGVDPGVHIVPFRGEYRRIHHSAGVRIEHHLYPVPDPDLPFLGLHVTRKNDGSLEVGPNAVLALGRESYRKRDWSLMDLGDLGTFPGFYRMGAAMLRTAGYEIFRSLSPAQFAADAAQLVPRLAPRDLSPSGAGVRAQAVDLRGKLVDDFVFAGSPHALHVINEAEAKLATATEKH